jgi:hypothetical protein
MLSFIIWIFTYSEVADGFRINSDTHNGEKSNSSLITGAIIRLKRIMIEKASA